MNNAHAEEAILNTQQYHWEQTFLKNEELFGKSPSTAAIKAAELFKKAGVKTILELGCGQGRDSFYFAAQGFRVQALDYTDAAVQAINDKAKALSLTQWVEARKGDVREQLPFKSQTFDACYSHMLFCMALTDENLRSIRDEILRTLKPGGINVYTARNINDPDYGRGAQQGEDLYESNGFIVHYFSKDKVNELHKGFSKIKREEFEEGQLPRRLYFVSQSKAR